MVGFVRPFSCFFNAQWPRRLGWVVSPHTDKPKDYFQHYRKKMEEINTGFSEQVSLGRDLSVPVPACSAAAAQEMIKAWDCGSTTCKSSRSVSGLEMSRGFHGFTWRCQAFPKTRNELDNRFPNWMMIGRVLLGAGIGMLNAASLSTMQIGGRLGLKRPFQSVSYRTSTSGTILATQMLKRICTNSQPLFCEGFRGQ